MGLNLVGVFDDATVAASAVQRIKQLGINERHVSTHATSASGAIPHAKRSREHHGFFSRLFGSDDSKNMSGHLAEATRRGCNVVTVHLENEEKAPQVERILEEAGAVDINQRVGAWQSSGYNGYDASADDFTPEQVARERETLQVLQEELHVGKRQVQAGGVRVHRVVTERPVQEEITLREEHAVIERHPVDRLATADDLRSLDAGSRDIEIRETREEAVVDKQARVVEEISIGKQATERTETIQDTVRRTDVDVEQLDAAQQGLLNRNDRTPNQPSRPL